MKLEIDHVTLAGPDLAKMEQAFARVGLTTDYGGVHSNGVTHMSLLGFEDGSYLELISTVKPGALSPLWGDSIGRNGGPCAWAVGVDDVALEARRLNSLGVPVQGPSYYHRRRPDGALVEWDLAFPGDHLPGAVLPFLIKDRTPRQLRVRPSASVSSQAEGGKLRPGSLRGVALVVLGVEDIKATAELFQRLFDWPAARVEEDHRFGARLASFEGAPVALAAPLRGSRWLSDRLEQLGESPCAFLIGTKSLERAARHFPLGETTSWLDRKTAWFDREALHGIRLGVIEP